jgi:hypothetical protein
MRLDGAGLPGSLVAASWKDGVPFLWKRPLGAGLVITAGLPVGVEHSDLALRPAFLALLDELLEEAEQRRGPGITAVGDRWTFPASKAVQIEGPAGDVPVSTEGCDADSASDCAPGQQAATPELAGQYTLVIDGVKQTRVARLDDHEITDPPGSSPQAEQASASGGEAGAVDASPELALVLLMLFAGELALRMGSEARRRRRAARALG